MSKYNVKIIEEITDNPLDLTTIYIKGRPINKLCIDFGMAKEISKEYIKYIEKQNKRNKDKEKFYG